MVGITWAFARWRNCDTTEGFLVANRNVNWMLGGASIAASWIWAPALFVSVQMAYQKGLAGLFWFTAPNILALAVFALLAPRIRQKMPEGFTFPQYIKHRLGSNRVHRVFLIPHFFLSTNGCNSADLRRRQLAVDADRHSCEHHHARVAYYCPGLHTYFRVGGDRRHGFRSPDHDICDWSAHPSVDMLSGGICYIGGLPWSGKY